MTHPPGPAQPPGPGQPWSRQTASPGAGPGYTGPAPEALPYGARLPDLPQTVPASGPPAPGAPPGPTGPVTAGAPPGSPPWGTSSPLVLDSEAARHLPQQVVAGALHVDTRSGFRGTLPRPSATVQHPHQPLPPHPQKPPVRVSSSMMLVAMAGVVLAVFTSALYAWLVADSGILEYRWDGETWLLIGATALPALTALVGVVAGMLRRPGGYWAIAVFGVLEVIAGILQVVIDPSYPLWIVGVIAGLSGMLLVLAGVRGATTATPQPAPAP